MALWASLLLPLAAAAEEVRGKAVYTLDDRAAIGEQARRFHGCVLFELRRRGVKLQRLSPSFHRRLRQTGLEAGLADPGALAYFNRGCPGVAERRLDALFWTLRDRPSALAGLLRLYWEQDGRPGDGYAGTEAARAAAPSARVAQPLLAGLTFDGIFARLGIVFVDSGGKSMGEHLDGQ